MEKKLTKSSTDRIVAGVCGGIGEFTGIPTWAIRILFILMSPTLPIYIILALVMPEED